jgi:hypothetical protein
MIVLLLQQNCNTQPYFLVYNFNNLITLKSYYKLYIIRNTIVFILLSVMFIFITKNSVLLSFYALNSSSFVELLCVNKEKPQLKCNGKCQLSKIAKEESKKNTPTTNINVQDEVVYCCNNLYSSKTTLAFKLISTQFSPFRYQIYRSVYLYLDDKPPELFS